jgi:hypothetical protein
MEAAPAALIATAAADGLDGLGKHVNGLQGVYDIVGVVAAVLEFELFDIEYVETGPSDGLGKHENDWQSVYDIVGVEAALLVFELFDIENVEVSAAPVVSAAGAVGVTAAAVASSGLGDGGGFVKELGSKDYVEEVVSVAGVVGVESDFLPAAAPSLPSGETAAAADTAAPVVSAAGAVGVTAAAVASSGLGDGGGRPHTCDAGFVEAIGGATQLGLAREIVGFGKPDTNFGGWVEATNMNINCDTGFVEAFGGATQQGLARELVGFVKPDMSFGGLVEATNIINCDAGFVEAIGGVNRTQQHLASEFVEYVPDTDLGGFVEATNIIIWTLALSRPLAACAFVAVRFGH